MGLLIKHEALFSWEIHSSGTAFRELYIQEYVNVTLFLHISWTKRSTVVSSRNNQLLATENQEDFD